MWQRKRRERIRRGIKLAVLLMVCVAGVYGSYNGDIVEAVGANVYQNMSPPMAAARNGVTLAMAHSRYLTVATISLTLTNLSHTDIYVPGDGPYQPSTGNDRAILVPPSFDACLATDIEVWDAHRWRLLGHGCGWSWSCPSGQAMAPPPPGVLVIAPGQTAIFPVYDGESTYPPWSSGVYQFSILYTRMPFQSPPRFWSYPLAIPQGELLTTGLVTLTGAWWIPPHFHHTPPWCPVAY